MYVAALVTLNELLDSLSNWLNGLQPVDIVAIILFFIAASFALAVSKSALKAIGAVITVLAGLYILAPDLYDQAWQLIDQFFNALARLI